MKYIGRPNRVNFRNEVQEYGLRLCPSNMHHSNFMIDGDGKVVALDFGATCFLPVSFFEMALFHHDIFAHLLRPLVVCPTVSLTQVDALLAASGNLIPYGTNDIGECFSLFSIPLPGDLNLHRSPARAQGNTAA